MESNLLSKRLDTIARTIVLVTIFILPFITLPSAWLPLVSVKMSVIGIGAMLALILWASARLNEHRVALPNTNLLWLSLGILVAYLVSAMLSGNVFNAVLGFGFERDTLLAMASLFGLLAAVVVTVRNTAQLIRMQFAVLASFLIIGVFHVIRAVVGADVVLPELFSTNATATTLIGWQDVGIFAGLALLITIASLALFQTQKVMLRGVLYVTGLIALFLLAIVNVTAVWTTVAVATFLLALHLFSDASYDRETGRFKPRLPFRKLIPSIVVFVVSAVFIVAGSTLGNTISDYFNVPFVDVRPSWEGTVAVGTGVFADSPLFGVGPNAFKDGWIDYKPLPINETNFWNTDFTFGVGFIPTLFITGGLVVGFLWLCFFALFIALGARIFTKRMVQLQDMYAAISTYLIAAYLWILAIVFVPQTVMLAYAFVFTGAAIVAGQVIGVIRTRELSSSAGYTSGMVLIGSMLALAVIGASTLFLHVERTVASAMISRAVVAANAGDTPRAQYIAGHASLFGSDVRPEQLQTSLGIAQILEVLNEEVRDDVEGQRTRLQAAIANTVTAAQSVLDRDPDNYRHWLLVGDVYARLASLNIEGASERAIESYTEASERYPQNPLMHIRLARLAFDENRLDDARGYIADALKLKNNYTDAYYMLSQIAIREDNVTEAISSIEAAVLLQPGNAGLLFQLGILHYSVGAYEKTIPVLERAIALNPDYANALYFLGLAYDRVGKSESALAAFERIAVLNPDNEEVQQILEALDDGRPAVDVLGPTADLVSRIQQLPLSEE